MPLFNSTAIVPRGMTDAEWSDFLERCKAHRGRTPEEMRELADAVHKAVAKQYGDSDAV